MAVSWLSKTKKSKNEQIKSQNNDDLLFDSNGLVHKEFLPPGQTVNQQFYIEVLEWLRKKNR
jgi:hypothetical protein